MTPKNKSHIFSRLAGLAVALLGISSGASAQDHPWKAVDDFRDGVSASWVYRNPAITLTQSGEDVLVRLAGASTAAAYIPFPTSIAPFTTSNNPKFTIALTMYLPVDATKQNQVGFGVSNDPMVVGTGWVPVGARNRFQTANDTPPQILVKAGVWTTDVLDSTIQGLWYNIWLVYDLNAGDTGTVSVYAVDQYNAAELPSTPNVTLPLTVQGTEDLRTNGVKYFAFGAGLASPANFGPATGGNFGSIWVDAGEHIKWTPTSVATPPEWLVIDTFSNGSPDANWTGDLDGMTLSFANDRLKVSGKTGGSGLPSIAAPLPQSVAAGEFTVYFRLMVPSAGALLNIGLVSQAERNEAGLTARIGGNDRFVTNGTGASEKVTRFTERVAGPDLLNLPATRGQWYHVWIHNDLINGKVAWYRIPVGETVPAEPVPFHTYDGFSVSRTSFDYIALGLGNGFSSAAATGFEIDNIQFASTKLLTVPEEIGPPPGYELPEPWKTAEANKDANGWFWATFDTVGNSTGLWMNNAYNSLPWVWTQEHGWLFLDTANMPGVWMFNDRDNLGWLFTNVRVNGGTQGVYPEMYSQTLGFWVYFSTDTWSPTNRWFWNQTTGWFHVPLAP